MSPSEPEEHKVSAAVSDIIVRYRECAVEILELLGNTVKSNGRFVDESDAHAGASVSVAGNPNFFEAHKSLVQDAEEVISRIRALEDEIRRPKQINNATSIQLGQTAQKSLELRGGHQYNEERLRSAAGMGQEVSLRDEKLARKDKTIVHLKAELNIAVKLIVEHEAKIESQNQVSIRLKDEEKRGDSLIKVLNAKTADIIALKQVITKKNAQIRSLTGVGIQEFDTQEQEKQDERLAYMQKLLWEQSWATDAAREDNREIYENLRSERQKVQQLEAQLESLQGGRRPTSTNGESRYPERLQYPETELDGIRRINSLLGFQQNRHNKRESQSFQVPDKPTEDELKSVQDLQRMAKGLETAHELLGIKNNQVEILEERLKNLKFILGCKDHVIGRWECALGTCYAELERVQMSGDVERRVVKLDTCLLFEDESYPHPMTIRTIMREQEVVENHGTTLVLQDHGVKGMETPFQSQNGDNCVSLENVSSSDVMIETLRAEGRDIEV